MNFRLRVAALPLLLWGCHSPLPDAARFGVVDKSVTLSSDGVQLVGDLGAGAVALYQQIGGAGNMVFSPFAVQEAMAMMYVGAQGATATDLAHALSWNLDPNTLGPAYANLTSVIATSLAASPNVNLITATRLWSNASNVLLPDYASSVENSFGASVVPLNFANDPGSAAIEINSWVSQQTDGKIPQLLSASALNGATLVQTAALYVKAPWQSSFARDSAAVTPFYASDGNTTQVAMLRSSDTFNYAATGEYQAVDVVYQGNALSMLVVMPSDNVAAFTANMDGNTVRNIVGSMYPTALDLSFPPFDVSADPNMLVAFKALGMKVADSNDAQFGIYKNANAQIAAVIEKATISVDEHGTEAAAAASVIAGTTSAPQATDTFLVNYPFVYFIHDLATNTILFMGQVMDPTNKS